MRDMRDMRDTRDARDMRCVQDARGVRDIRSMFFSEDGFSTVGVALALLITLSMVFASAQIYQINSASSEIQEVADAAALAAEGQVAQFYVASQICDAALLTMGLASMIIAGVGVVCLCVPTTQAIGTSLLDASRGIVKARGVFHDDASKALNTLQKALPFLSGLAAMNVAVANGNSRFGTGYFGMAVLVPIQGEELKLGDQDEAEKALDQAESTEEDLKETAERAEELAKEAERYKLTAFNADCGSNPKYCMYERAKKLANLSDSKNPLFKSIDSWGFAAAFNRAKHYYSARLSREAPEGSSVNERANSALRKRFYAYAVEQMRKGYVHEDSTGTFSAYFPLLPKNTDEMKGTHLYTDSVYPISREKGQLVMHAWSGCPGIKGGVVGTGSLSRHDAENMPVCSYCDFKASSLGKVAAASTSVSNGFEYHYNIVARAAKDYQQAREDYAREASKLKGEAGGLFAQIVKAMQQAGESRIHMKPPGRYGAVALVATTSSMSTSRNFSSKFVSDAGSLGCRAAISAATLAPDSSDNQENLITTFLDGLMGEADWGVGKVVTATMDIWGSVLGAYCSGQKGLQEAIAKACGPLNLVSASHLGTWASAKFAELVKSVGLEPADLDAWKPVTVNSVHVLSADSSSFSSRLLSAKNFASSMSGNDIFTSSINALERKALQGVDELKKGYTIASINFTGADGEGIPIVVVFPEEVISASTGFVNSVAERLRGIAGDITGVRQWR